MKILYEDSQILVVYKEGGLPVQSAKTGMIDLESKLKNYLAEKEGGSVPYLAVVHRLDQPVEGILAFAKTQKAAAHLSKQVQDGRMKKTYLAVVHWNEENLCKKQSEDNMEDHKWHLLTDYLLKDARTNMSKAVSENQKGSKKSQLEYQILKKGSDQTALIKIRLLTGRHHQIRVQMSHLGKPLVGDRKYGAQHMAKPGENLALCAYSLKLEHPANGKNMEFQCRPEGKVFQQYEDKLS